jgi:hypothetical protein
MRENIKRSVDMHVAAYVAPGLPRDAIDYGDPSFNENDHAEWIRVHLLGPQFLTMGRTKSASVRLQEVLYRPHLNLYVKPSRQVIAHRIDQMRDLVSAAFREWGGIVIYDLVADPSGNTALGQMPIRRVNLDDPVTSIDKSTGLPVEDLSQWAYSVDCRWIERWAP